MSQHHGNWIDLKSSFVLNRGMGSKSRTSWFQWSIPSNMWCHSVPLACQAAPRPYRQASLLALCDGPGILWVHRGGNWSQADANPQRRNIKPVFTGLSGTMAGHGGDCKWFIYICTWLIHIWIHAVYQFPYFLCSFICPMQSFNTFPLRSLSSMWRMPHGLSIGTRSLPQS